MISIQSQDGQRAAAKVAARPLHAPHKGVLSCSTTANSSNCSLNPLGPLPLPQARAVIVRGQCIVYGMPGSGKTTLCNSLANCADTDTMGPPGCDDSLIHAKALDAIKLGKTLFTNRWRMVPLLAQFLPVVILQPPKMAQITSDNHGGVTMQRKWRADFPRILKALLGAKRGVAIADGLTSDERKEEVLTICKAISQERRLGLLTALIEDPNLIEFVSKKLARAPPRIRQFYEPIVLGLKHGDCQERFRAAPDFSQIMQILKARAEAFEQKEPCDESKDDGKYGVSEWHSEQSFAIEPSGGGGVGPPSSPLPAAAPPNRSPPAAPLAPSPIVPPPAPPAPPPLCQDEKELWQQTVAIDGKVYNYGAILSIAQSVRQSIDSDCSHQQLEADALRSVAHLISYASKRDPPIHLIQNIGDELAYAVEGVRWAYRQREQFRIMSLDDLKVVSEANADHFGIRSGDLRKAQDSLKQKLTTKKSLPKRIGVHLRNGLRRIANVFGGKHQLESTRIPLTRLTPIEAFTILQDPRVAINAAAERFRGATLPQRDLQYLRMTGAILDHRVVLPLPVDFRHSPLGLGFRQSYIQALSPCDPATQGVRLQ